MAKLARLTDQDRAVARDHARGAGTDKDGAKP
jgi:hypothetical protein